ncbi:hypothetical protein CEN47_23305, partial [Fischerella thermalis CCMEE 5319]
GVTLGFLLRLLKRSQLWIKGKCDRKLCALNKTWNTADSYALKQDKRRIHTMQQNTRYAIDKAFASYIISNTE